MTTASPAPALIGGESAPGLRPSRWISLAELVSIAVATPLLVFPNRFSVLGLALLCFVWLLRPILDPGSLVRTAADWPLAGLMLMTSISLYPSVDLSLSLPKLYGLLLGYTIFAVVVRNCRTQRDRAVLVFVLSVGGIGLAGIGLVGTSWLVPKVPFLAQIYAHLPRLIYAGQTADGATSGFHPNEVAGTLTLLLPVAVAVWAYSSAGRWRLMLALAAGAMALTMALTFSRSAWFGTAVGISLIVLLRWPRLVVALPILLIASGGLLWRFGLSGYINLVVGLPTGSDLAGKVVGREEIWTRALVMIQDFPFTGIGLNTFPLVLTTLYPTFVNGPVPPIPHAHNLFLQTAVDLGLPGLFCFVGLLVAAGVTLARARHTSGWDLGLVVGLAAGLIAYLIFGLTDATPGARPGVFLWLDLGAALSLGSVSLSPTELSADPLPRRFIDYASGFLLVGAATLGALIAVLHLTVLP